MATCSPAGERQGTSNHFVFLLLDKVIVCSEPVVVLLHRLLCLLLQRVCLFKAVWQSLADLNQSTPAFCPFLFCSLLCPKIHFQFSQEELPRFSTAAQSSTVACMSNMLNTPLFLFHRPPSLPQPPSLVSCAAAVIAASKANVFIETKGVCRTHPHTHAELTNSRVTHG